MSNKLQELTDKLYKEGLNKGKEEGEKILADAKMQAEAIVEAAKKEAADIKTTAVAEAESLKSKVQSDLKAGAEQCLQAAKKDIENLLVNAVTSTDSLGESGFLKEIIRTVAEKFSASEAADIALILPEKLQSELEPWIKGELATSLKCGVQASFSKKVNGGFTIGPKDGSYYISLTDETFRELIASYIRPVTKKLLFGE